MVRTKFGGGVRVASVRVVSAAEAEPLEAPAPMTEEMERVVNEENRLRRLFVSDRTNPELDDPHLALIDVFSRPTAEFAFEEESPAERAVPKILTRFRRRSVPSGTPSIVGSRDAFLARWREFTHGALEGLDWSHLFAAGGSVLACVNGSSSSSDGFGGSDIDLFVHGISDDRAANELLRSVHATIVRNVKTQPLVVRTGRAVTFVCEYPVRTVQVVLRLYRSPAEVLLGFDVDCCSVGFDGSRVWCTERWKHAQTRSRNVVNPTRRSFNYEARLFKYSRRGYAVAVPDLDKARVKRSIFPPQCDPADAAKMQGLAKLLRYEFFDIHEDQQPRVFYSKALHRMLKMAPGSVRRFSSREQEAALEGGVDYSLLLREYADAEAAQPSDYSAVYIPWGPRWKLNAVRRVLEFRDKAQFFAHWTSELAKKRKEAGGRAPAAAATREKQADHVHTFVTGIDGAITGEASSYWCSLCKKHVPLSGDGGPRLVSGPLAWEHERPCCQDFEDGELRMLTGAFSLIHITQPFEAGVYRDFGDAEEDGSTAHPLQRLPAAPSIQPFMPLQQQAAPAFGTSASVPCPKCGAMQPSQGALSHHLLSEHSGPDQKHPVTATPFGLLGVPPFGATPPRLVPPAAAASRLFGAPAPSVSQFSFGSAPPPPQQQQQLQQLQQIQQQQIQQLQQQLQLQQQPQQQGFTFPIASAAPVPAAAPLFGAPAATSDTQQLGAKLIESVKRVSSRPAMALLLVQALAREHIISDKAKGIVKDLIVQEDKMVVAAVDVFLADGDLADLADTFNRIASKK